MPTPADFLGFRYGMSLKGRYIVFNDNRRLEELREACRGHTNLLEPIRAALKERAALGEVCGVMREEFGEYSEA